MCAPSHSGPCPAPPCLALSNSQGAHDDHGGANESIGGRDLGKHQIPGCAHQNDAKVAEWHDQAGLAGSIAADVEIDPSGGEIAVAAAQEARIQAVPRRLSDMGNACYQTGLPQTEQQTGLNSGSLG